MLQINIKSFKKNILNIYVKFLKNLFEKLLLEYSIFNIPTKKKKITLLKSPHVHKKAREQFQLNMYKKTIYIKNFKNINYLNLNSFILNKPKLVNINIKHIGK